MHASTMHSLVNNMHQGLISPFSKIMKLNGIGYRAELLSTNKLQFFMHFSHPVILDFPEEVNVEMNANNRIKLSSCDKQLLGVSCARIHELRIPEKYKGTGACYEDVKLQLKEVKKKK